MGKPYEVAILGLERSPGVLGCEKCDDVLEEVVLMSDATLVCPDCGTEFEDLKEISSMFAFAEPIDEDDEEGDEPAGEPA